MTHFYLTEQDVAELKGLLRAMRNTKQTTQQRPDVPPQITTTPEVYVALTPKSGIPGRTSGPAETGTGTGTGPDYGDIPGSADCDVWQHQVGIMMPAARGKVTVYNFAEGTIGGNLWILVERDKFGTWWPAGQITGGGGVGGAIEVADSTGSPDYFNVSKLIFEGPAKLTQPAAGQAELGVFATSGAGHKTGLVPDPGSTDKVARILTEHAVWRRISSAGMSNPGSGGTLAVGDVAWNTLDWDLESYYSTSTTFVVPSDGYYRASANVWGATPPGAAGEIHQLGILLAGVLSALCQSTDPAFSAGDARYAIFALSCSLAFKATAGNAVKAHYYTYTGGGHAVHGGNFTIEKIEPAS